MALVGTFGALVFETSGMRVHTFSDLAVSTENRFAEHAVHLETPVLEYVGPGLTEVHFSMNFNKQWGSDPTASPSRYFGPISNLVSFRPYWSACGP